MAGWYFHGVIVLLQMWDFVSSDVGLACWGQTGLT